MTPQEKLTEWVGAYQSSCILAAATEVDLFSPILHKKRDAAHIAAARKTDLRATTVLLDALCMIGLLDKDRDTEPNAYRVRPEYVELLDPVHPKTFVPMILHQANCLRRWSQLAWTVKTGMRPPETSGIHGPLADHAAFILAMNAIGSTISVRVVEHIRKAGLLSFSNVLDLGGASGTYTYAFLRELPDARATIFDLPLTIERTRERLAREPEIAPRIRLVEGDFYRDELPGGFDAVWISAIIHQHGRAESRMLYEKVFRALELGGRVMIRDVYCHADRTGPRAAALFAVNMLAGTDNGMVYTAGEVCEDLATAGFQNARLAIPAEDMTAVVVAEKP